MAAAKETLMPPDDLPTDDATEDSTKSPGTKRLIRKEHERGAEAEVRGGSAQPDEPPIEQQQRQDRVKR
jgi:hypothetical protein